MMKWTNDFQTEHREEKLRPMPNESNPTSNFRGIQIRIQIYLQYRFFRFLRLSKDVVHLDMRTRYWYISTLFWSKIVCLDAIPTGGIHTKGRKKGDYIEFHFLYSPLGINQIMIFFITYYLSNYFWGKRNISKCFWSTSLNGI